MNITEVRIAGDELILKVKDLVAARKWAYKFKAGDYDIVKRRKKRSNDANALCWELCTQIADELRTDKDSVYVDMIKSYGQSDLVAVAPEVRPEHYFKYFDYFGKGMVEGKEVCFYKVYRGSSDYDTREFSILLDGIISEAKALDIEVISEQEKALLLDAWGKGAGHGEA